ncbi:MAG: homoserine O-acetyltransferase [Proteobacteria bacterium]|nr:homoserine O-acetyltransferase [Pseudomonadota bacterium]MBU1545603.1 homoserine O-acetyltransferase [Pseudomonadota bacterium]MBU2619521.1 homoserine O-acetyltransferase [Pseudomonadota bacterium]
MNPACLNLVEKQFFTFGEPPHELVLESGERLGPMTLAYETLGTLAPDKSNAILVVHALTGDSHVAGCYTTEDARPGWWEIMVGPGKAIDTERYFVICANVLGGCMGSTGPSSINPVTGKPYGVSFPLVTIGDMVTAQKALIDHLGISRLLAVVGGSVGGMQVLAWCARYPQMVRAAIPLATTPRHSAQSIAFNEVARQAIMADPHWQGGDYYGQAKPDLGLAVARMIGHITYLSNESMRQKFGRQLKSRDALSFHFDAGFEVESYLRYQGNKFVERFDANSFLYLTKAADYFDLDDYAASGLSGAEISFLVVAFTSDWLYPTEQSRALVQLLKRSGLDVSFCEIQSDWGHDAFLLPNERLHALVGAFLSRIYQEGTSEGRTHAF